MARAVVTAGLLTWSVAGLVAIGLGVAGTGWLYERLPALSIDVGAVGGAATALGVGMLLVALGHLVVLLLGVGARGTSGAAGIVLCSVMGFALLALAAAAATSASVSAATATGPLLLATAAIGLGCLGYLGAAMSLIRARARIGPWEAD